MKNFNLELFNLAINFAKNTANQNSPKTVLTIMGFPSLESRTVDSENGYVTCTEYLLSTGVIISVKKLEGNELKATIK